MKLTLQELRRLALIGAQLRVGSGENAHTGRLTDISDSIMTLNCSGTQVRIPLNEAQALCVLASLPDDDDVRRLTFVAHSLLTSDATKVGAIRLRTHCASRLPALVERLSPALQAHFSSNAFLGGDTRRLDFLPLQSELAALPLSPQDMDLAQALLFTAFFNHPQCPDADADAMQVWLRHHDGGRTLSDDFIRDYGALLACTSVAFANRSASFNLFDPTGALQRPRRVSLARMPVFMFWCDQLLRTHAPLLTDNAPMWSRYLQQCVVFSHYAPLKTYLASCEQGFALKALRDLFLLMDEYPWALQAENGSVPVPLLLLHLTENGITYGVRLTRMADLLIQNRLLGCRTAAYVYEYRRNADTLSVVTGCLTERRFRVEEQPEAMRDLCRQMSDQFLSTLDYDPVLLTIGEDGTIFPAGITAAAEGGDPA